ncbi:biotin synthase [Francisella sp. Scap27]|uniref:biotin synthase n=1 Tax=Francisella sp. Scap27 TaxID=2589986 RepID=UPI0015BA69C8|nr:biotin synthase [Francisella sp. Scap27]QLE78994.1 biotin synthase [Francisella sp. Scap27]
MFNYIFFNQRLKSSRKYNTSFIKNEIALRLLKRLEFINLNPENIFIDGYQDESYISVLKDRFPEANISNDLLQKYDLIISNTTIHLNPNIADKLDQYYEMLNHEGILLFSTFGDNSFSSINSAFSTVDNLPHTNAMIDAKTWGGMLQSSSYKSPAIESDLVTFTYENTNVLFNDIRELNEPLADTKMQTSLTGKNKWQSFIAELKNNLQLEVEALYGYAVRKDSSDLRPKANPNRVSLEDLKKQIADFKKG